MALPTPKLPLDPGKVTKKVAGAVKGTAERIAKPNSRTVTLKDGTQVSARGKAHMAKEHAESRQREHVESIEDGIKSGKFAFRNGPGTEIIMAGEKERLDTAGKIKDSKKRAANIMAINDDIRKRRLKDQANLKKSKKL